MRHFNKKTRGKNENPHFPNKNEKNGTSQKMTSYVGDVTWAFIPSTISCSRWLELALLKRWATCLIVIEITNCSRMGSSDFLPSLPPPRQLALVISSTVKTEQARREANSLTSSLIAASWASSLVKIESIVRGKSGRVRTSLYNIIEVTKATEGSVEVGVNGTSVTFFGQIWPKDNLFAFKATKR